MFTGFELYSRWVPLFFAVIPQFSLVYLLAKLVFSSAASHFLERWISRHRQMKTFSSLVLVSHTCAGLVCNSVKG